MTYNMFSNEKWSEDLKTIQNNIGMTENLFTGKELTWIQQKKIYPL